jgi:hypothetical protein
LLLLFRYIEQLKETYLLCYITLYVSLIISVYELNL